MSIARHFPHCVVADSIYRQTPSIVYCRRRYPSINIFYSMQSPICLSIKNFHSLVSPTISIDKFLPQPVVADNRIYRYTPSAVYCCRQRLSIDTFHSLLSPKISSDRHLPQPIVADNIYRQTPSAAYCRRRYLSTDTFHSLLSPTMSNDRHLPQSTYDGHRQCLPIDTLHIVFSPTVYNDRHLPHCVGANNIYRQTPSAVYCRRQCLSIDSFPSPSEDIHHQTSFTVHGHRHVYR